MNRLQDLIDLIVGATIEIINIQYDSVGNISVTGAAKARILRSCFTISSTA